MDKLKKCPYFPIINIRHILHSLYLSLTTVLHCEIRDLLGGMNRYALRDINP